MFVNEADFLEAVGKVDKSYIEECITYQLPEKKHMWMKNAGLIAACLAAVVGILCAVTYLHRPVIIEKDGFYIENGVLLRYTGDSTDVTFPDEVKTVADYSFLENGSAKNIKAVHLGTNVRKVEMNAFAGLAGLEEITVADDNPSFVCRDGLVMTADGSVLLHYERRGETSFVIPDSVRVVAAHAVQATDLEEIGFGKAEYIGCYAFADSYQLASIRLPDSVKAIGEGAFSGCTAAVDGTVPAGAELIGKAFENVPFYNSMLAGQMCPGEEIVRGLITPSEAVLRSDLDSLTAQIGYVLASVRGDTDHEPDEAAMFGYAAVQDLPEKPADMTVPETFTLEDLSFADEGWGGTGIYDLQIILPTGDYRIVMEAYGYDLFSELYWKDARFRLADVYYVKDDETAAENTFGWTASFDRKDGFYTDITLVNEDGRIIHQDTGYQCIDAPTLTFSPNGTRVAVEYGDVRGYYSFYVLALNGDTLMEPSYPYTEYLSRFYGTYKKGSLYFADEDNVEGENEFGKFRLNLYEFDVTYPEGKKESSEEKRDGDTVVELTTDSIHFPFTGSGEQLPHIPNAFTLHVTGFETPVTLEMENYSHPLSITAYGQTLPVFEGCEFFGHGIADIFEADDAVIFSWNCYGIGYTYIIGENFSFVLEPGAFDSVSLFTDGRDGRLLYKRTNNKNGLMQQAGGLSAAVAYDEVLYSIGNASVRGGKLVLGDADTVYAVGDVFDLDTEFEERWKEQGYDTIEEVFAHNQPLHGDSITQFMLSGILDKNVGELRAMYGELKLLYSEEGPGQPVYSMEYFPGVLLVFHNYDADAPLTDGMVPAELIFTEDYIFPYFGFRIGADAEISAAFTEWEAVEYDLINGLIRLRNTVFGGRVSVVISGSGLELPEDEAPKEEWDAWKAEFSRNPAGKVIQMRLERHYAE